MESSNLQCETSILNRRKKRKAKEEENIRPKRNCRGAKTKNVHQLNSRSKFLSTCFPQSFSLPNSIMYYISKNPTTTKLYQNLIQTCKYFFIKNPIIVSPNFPNPYSRDSDKLVIGKTGFYFSKLICKFWITENFYFTSILAKLYKCDAKIVTLQNKVISFNELSMFTKTAEDISLNEITVNDSDDSIVPFEIILEIFVNVKKFRFFAYSSIPNFTSKTFDEILTIPHFSKLQLFFLKNIPDTFDIETFYAYMKKNNTTKFNLIFDKSISAPYKNRLEEIIDELFSTKIFNYKPPFIYFDSFDPGKKHRLFRQFF
uniref:Uncharacterized protein n=1 Tax=Panagrolaimus davidi TaxID=227884 RepID=A0A914QYT9_9BILA